MEENKLNLNKEKIKRLTNSLPYIVCVIGILVIIVRALMGNDTDNSSEYLVKKGKLEYTQVLEGIVIKDENVIVRDPSKAYISTISSGDRVANNSIIATYKTEEYEKYLKELEDMDNEILELMQELPKVYSSETQSLVQDINYIVKSAYGTTSYLDMQLKLNSCNEILTRKADIIANSIETGTVIKDLINKRNEYIENAKDSNDNILATKAGIVSYQTDNLENVFVLEETQNYTFDFLKEKLDDAKNTGNIKIVDNYEACICVRVPLEYKDYININKIYNMKIVEVGDYVYRGKITKVTVDEQNKIIDVLFSINSGIENLINIRDCQVEITWWEKDGLYVPVSAINKYEEKELSYLKVMRFGKTVEVPVIIDNTNGIYAIVRNYKSEELENLGIVSEYTLQLYDRLITNE